MRSISIFAVSLLAPLMYHAQGINNTGAFIVMSGASQIYIDGSTNGDYTSSANGRITPSATGIITLEGDWNNNAGNTGFTADAGTVVLNDVNQSINGSSSTTFYNLTLQGTGTKTLNVNTTVGGVATTTGVLSIGTRPLNLNSRILTISNTAPTAVTFTTGYVISETNAALNPSIMRWSMGATVGTFTFPFGTAGGTQIPLDLNKTVATVATVDIATRPTAVSANTPWASTVTHMFDPTLAQDGSDEAVIDRWWEITSSPAAITADVTFRYTGAENTLAVPYNTGNLGAQYWDGAGWAPNNSNIGSAPAILVGVGAVTAPTLTLGTTYTPWVLSAVGAPLPVEFVSVNANCDNQLMHVTWITASEQNNDFFTVERSDNGYQFYPIGNADGAGTSSQMHYYEFIDPSPVNGTVYYRIRQTDFNGQSDCSSVVAGAACSGTTFIDAFATGSDINLLMNVSDASDYHVTVYDARSRLVAEQELTASTGSNRFVLNSVVTSSGIYLVVATSATGEMFTKRMYVEGR